MMRMSESKGEKRVRETDEDWSSEEKCKTSSDCTTVFFFFYITLYSNSSMAFKTNYGFSGIHHYLSH